MIEKDAAIELVETAVRFFTEILPRLTRFYQDYGNPLMEKLQNSDILEKIGKLLEISG